MADPSKKRVVCPVVDCEDRFVTQTNKKPHYNNVHFSKNPILEPYRPSLFAKMGADDHDEYTPCGNLVFSSMQKHNVSNDVAIILMLDVLLKKHGVDVDQVFLGHAMRKPTNAQQAAGANELESSEEEVVQSPPSKKRLMAKQAAAKRRAAKSGNK
ncbi:hypothetical protein DYB25_011895 [Aphanomyces astaci]|uniref:C2H2-type domain-containing protein n=1 Tax=Aphanomyces astaci TaxID=112090 RepID=A0A396ZU71_APHAT|nr:hypothetical protein DYB25_011895 [Aphanomyces astaci]RHY01370.1 hypothetical protein DYB36_008815 [Aphanomyces astaci]RHY40176.1 hypothetical protein DYB30_013712 [Aphanomyces astaci]RHY43879.1 hypothetical protein DYB38_010223 [Aphanomyces astaci]RHY76793.1 hypothetical protein DYB34_008752 [Aphanomyces astaci]